MDLHLKLRTPSIYIYVLMTEGLSDDEQGGFRAGRGCVDQIGERHEIKM